MFERALYCGLVALAVAAVWLIARSGNPEPKKPQKPLTRHDELIAARRSLRRQIEILRSPLRGRDYTGYSQKALNDLQATLREIETELDGAKSGPLLGRGATPER